MDGRYILLIVVIIIVFGLREISKRKTENIKKLKKKLNLKGEAGSLFKKFDLTGIYNGRILCIWLENHSGTKESNKVLYTHISLIVEESGEFCFSIVPDISAFLKNLKFGKNLLVGFAEKVKKTMKIEDIEIGNKEFDKNWVISSNDKEKITSLLDYSTCERIEKMKNGLCEKINKLQNGFSIKLENESFRVKNVINIIKGPKLELVVKHEIDDIDCLYKLVLELDNIANNIEEL